MNFSDIIIKSKSKIKHTNLITFLENKVLYYSNINNREDLEKYKINILNYVGNDSYNYRIFFIEDVKLYNESISVLKNEKFEKIQVHSITKYKVYSNSELKIYVSDNCGQEYLIIKKAKDVFIIAKEKDDSRCLLYVIREIIRIGIENKRNIVLHSACIQTENNTILILGDSGSGKTTLLFQLLEKSRSKFISNDRTIINDELEAKTFPIKIRIGEETIKNIDTLYSYTKKNNIDVTKEKTSLYPLDIEKWKKSFEFKEKKITKIIIPHIQLNEINKYRKLERKRAYKVIEKNCYTPNDPEWINKWFVEDYIYSEEEIIRNKNKILNRILEEINIYKLDYNGIIDKETLNQILEG